MTRRPSIDLCRQPVRGARVGWIGAAQVVWLAALALAACSTAVKVPDLQRRAEQDGVIEAVVAEDSNGVTYRLDTGQVVRWERTTPMLVTSGFDPGDLLLLGTEGGEPWSASLIASTLVGVPDPCFALYTRGRDAGREIHTELGLALPKAADFSDRAEDGIFGQDMASFCLNERGEATSYQ